LDIESFIARGLQILLALGGAYLIATWFVLAVWTFRDIESRSRSVVTQVFSTLLVVLFWIPGWILYRLLRPAETLDQAYQRSLEEEYLLNDLQDLPLCPTCNHFVEDEWRICPHCNTQLREDCDNCGRLIDLSWDLCPYCGTQHVHEHDRDDVKIDEDRWIDPAAIEKRLRDEERRRLREETRALPAATAATTLGRDLIEPVTVRAGSDQAEAPVAAGSNGVASGSSVREPIGTEVPAPPAGPDLSLLREDGESDETVEDDVTTVPERFRVR
jgi:RNA polymerase subunit RPABC4/transcription elongation factor Spt4